MERANLMGVGAIVLVLGVGAFGYERKSKAEPPPSETATMSGTGGDSGATKTGATVGDAGIAMERGDGGSAPHAGGDSGAE